jgi:CHAT domain-containing protein/Tfp pilus assembly protein PilF
MTKQDKTRNMICTFLSALCIAFIGFSFSANSDSNSPVNPEFEQQKSSLQAAIATAKEKKDTPELIRLYEQLIALTEGVFGPESVGVATEREKLGDALYDLGRYDQALPLYQRALAILERALGPDHPDVAATLNNLAITYYYLAQYDQALPLYQRALAIYEKALGAEHLNVAATLNNLANTYKPLAQYDQALPLYQRALVVFEKARGPEHPDVAMTLNNLANTYQSLAQYDQALPLYQRALAILERALGPEHPDVAITLNNLAFIYGDLAQYDQALPLYQRALAILERALGPEHPDVAMTLDNLANTYKPLAQYDQALPLYQRALAIREKALGPEHPDVAMTLNNLAVTYRDLAQYDQALPLYQRTLAILERALGPEHPNVATTLNNLAFIYRDLAQNDQALPLYQRALVIREKALGPEHPDTGNSYQGLGDFYKKQSLPDVAITFYKLAVNVRQSTRERVRRLGVEELESYTRSVETVYQDLAAVLTEEGRLAEAQQVLELLKEDELFEFIRRSETKDLVRHKIQPTPTEQAWITQYRTVADRLFALGQEEQALEKIPAGELTAAQRQRLAQIKADLKVAHQAFTQFMGEIKAMVAASKQQRSADVRELSQTAQSETREILQALGDEVALVQYFITDTELNMIVTTARLQKSYKSKIVAKELNLKIKQFLLLLKHPRGNPQQLAQELYQLVFAPMAADLAQAGIRTVMISGDGALRYVPFGALHDGQDYLVTRYTLPTYTSVTRHKLKESSQSVWTGAGLGVTQAHGDLKALPAVRDELHSIMGAAMPGEIYLDQAFTAPRLQAVGRQRLPVVHIASHFQFSPGTELNSFLLLGDGSQLNLGAFRTGDYQFGGVDLLTLSACETGLGGGRDEKGREIEGFGVIAQQKGAKAVIATLWPVEDKSTSLLMDSLYRNRETQGLSKIEALRQAQLSLQKQAKYAHPYYWAPFILMGNWR